MIEKDKQLFLQSSCKKIIAVILTIAMMMQGLFIGITAASNVVVVLDPGHGGYDSGTVNLNLGLFEKNIALTIAEYCKQELERYEGVSVYLTRTDNASEPPIVDRAKYASQKGADCFISIHVNDADSSSAKGAEAFVSYYDKYSLKDLGNKILNKLSGVGFYNRGVKTKRSENGTTYPDGTLADYYAVVRENARLGISGMLLEHGFINNSTDAEILRSDTKLKEVGVADATAIAEYYGLKLKSGSSGGDGSTTVKNMPIIAEASANKYQCIAWARSKNATDTFVNNIDLYYEVAKDTGVDPVVAIAQYAHETGYGKYGGAVTESHRNPCGLKKTDATGDTSNDFQTFPDWKTGIQAQCDHLALYAGQNGYPRSNSPDPRHFTYLFGKATTVDGLTGTWATSSYYADSIKKLIAEIRGTEAVVPTLTLSVSSMSIDQGKSATLTAYATPSGSVKWSSSAESVASVDGDGRVTGKAGGTATITAKCSNGATATCKVTVLPKATGVSLNLEETDVTIGESVKLEATIHPSNSFENKLTWSSADESIAAVTSSGEVTGIKNGTTVITAAINDTVSAQCTIHVITAVNEVLLDTNEKTLYPGSDFTLIPTVLPESASNKTVTWSSDNETVATVDESGIVTAHATGKATITAASYNGITASCVVTVCVAAESVSLNKNSAELAAGESVALQATVLPPETFDKIVTWISSDIHVATVSTEGVVTAKSAGNAEITAKTHNGKTAVCKIVVTSAGTNVVIENKKTVAYTGEEFTLVAKTDGIISHDVTWKSSSPNVASVDASGKVTCNTPGTTTITVWNEKGGSDSYKLTVRQAVTSIVLKETTCVLQVGETFLLEASITPDGAYDKSLIWTTSNASVATVQDGRITAVGKGFAVVTAKTHNGLTASCKISVGMDGETEITGVIIDKKQAVAYTMESFQLTATVLPENAAAFIEWSSSDPNVATVDENGRVVCLKAGKTTIKAKAENGKYDSYLLTVLQAAESVTLNQSLCNVYKGAVIELQATILPADTSEKTVIWQSDHPEIASVDENGRVTTLSDGVAVITATAHNGKSAFCVVVVDVAAKPERVVIENIPEQANTGDSFQLTAKVFPENSADKTVTWESSEPSVATIDADGTVRCTGAGVTTIVVKTANGITASCELNVRQSVEEIRLDRDAVTLTVSDTTRLIATTLPENAVGKGVIWRSSDESIATVTENGEITALAEGEAVITAETENGISASCRITVIPQEEERPVVSPTGVIVANPITTAYSGDTFVLGAIVQPYNATDKTVSWTSSNPEIATVTASGRVHCLTAGKTVITVTTSNGKVNNFLLSVKQIATGITILETAQTVRQGECVQLTAVVEPENAGNKRVKWSVLNSEVASVSQDGVVTAKKPGSTTITAETHNGLFAYCKITVKAAFKVENSQKDKDMKQNSVGSNTEAGQQAEEAAIVTDLLNGTLQLPEASVPADKISGKETKTAFKGALLEESIGSLYSSTAFILKKIYQNVLLEK